MHKRKVGDFGLRQALKKKNLRFESSASTSEVTTTKTGHKLLPAYIRVIQGDGSGLGTFVAMSK